MDFIQCIQAAIENGTIRPEKGEEVKQAYAEALAERERAGETGQAAKDQAAMDAVAFISKKTKAKNWERVRAIQKSAEIYSRINESQNPVEVIHDLQARWEIASRRIQHEAVTVGTDFLTGLEPRAAGIIRPIEDIRNMVYAAYGKAVKDKSAVDMHRAFVEMQKFLNRLANSHGASIPENPNGRIGLFQSRTALRKREQQIADQMKREEGFTRLKRPSKEDVERIDKAAARRARDEYKRFHMENIDWELTGGGVPIPEGDQRWAFIEKQYLIVKSEGNYLKKPTSTMAESLAGRISRDSKMYYKTPEAYFEAQERFGEGDLFTQMVSDIEIMARDISMLEVLGPNPESMMDVINNVALSRSEVIDRTRISPRESMKSKVETALAEMRHTFKIHNNLVTMGRENRLAQFIAGTRNIAMPAVLGGAAISNFADPAFGIYARHLYKLPATRYMENVFGAVRALPSKEKRRALVHMTGSAESILSIALPYQRYVGLFDGPEWTRRMSDTFFRATWMTGGTQAQKWGHGMDMFNTFALYKDRPFSELPFNEHMQRWGIDEADWDEFRKTPVLEHMEGYGETYLLRPMDVLENRPDLDPDYAQSLADKFYDYTLAVEQFGVPQITERVQAQLGQGVDRTMVAGAVAQIFSAVKGFTMTIFYHHLNQIWSAPTLPGKLGRLARFATVLTVAGAMITQTKEMLLYGRDPLDMTTGRFWARAFLNGGSLGFLGDAFFSNVNQYRGGGLSEAFGGPVIELYNAFRNLTVGNVEELIQGQDTKFGREVVEFGQRYAPIPWQGQLLIDRLILEDLLILVDPHAYTRMRRAEARRASEVGQRHWWRPGAAAPSRLPDLRAVSPQVLGE